jgi:hypothetical protein
MATAVGIFAITSAATLASGVPSQAPATGTAQQEAPIPPAASAADLASLDAILTALYDVISAPAGAQRNWDRFRSLFVPGARLVPLAGSAGAPTTARVMTPDGYIERSGPAFAKAGFFEKEVARRVETFGALTHVWSTYEARRAPTDPEPFMTGINSIQLVNDGQRWWIVTVAWQAARPDLPLPEKYRK